MARSKIAQLPEELRAQIEKLIRDGHTVDAITAHLQALEQDVSRSSVGRYVKSYSESMKAYQAAQEVAGKWAEIFVENPDGDVGRLIAEMLKTLAFQTMADMGEEDKSIDPKDLMFLAKAVKDVSGATKINEERLEKVAQKAREEAAEIATDAAREAGLTDEMVEDIKARIFGVKK